MANRKLVAISVLVNLGVARKITVALCAERSSIVWYASADSIRADRRKLVPINAAKNCGGDTRRPATAIFAENFVAIGDGGIQTNRRPRRNVGKTIIARGTSKHAALSAAAFGSVIPAYARPS